MKLWFTILIMICTADCNAQSDTLTILLAKLHSGTIIETERKFLRTIAFDIQNRGQNMDEGNHDYVRAFQLTDSAIIVFTYLKDTLSVANNKKFKGYLLGRLGKFEEGKKEIAQAINGFQLKNAQWGVAVSHFDLARLYVFEKKLDSALLFCNTAIAFWKLKGDSSRVFINQNLLIDILTKSKKFSTAKAIQTESKNIAAAIKVHSQNLLDFYVVSENLFIAVKQPQIAKNYRQQYSSMLTELNATGINARSYFSEK